MNFFKFILWIALLFSETGCKTQSTKFKSPSNYDLNAPQVIKLPIEVDQISGLAYYEPDNSVFTIDDDHGNLYKIPLVQNPKIEQWKLGKVKDYEDLVLLNDHFYILNSNGKIVHFSFSFPIEQTDEKELSIKGPNEFETLYAESASNRLIMMCKYCAADKKDQVSAYAFDLATNSFKDEPALILKKKEIEEKLDKKIARFEPSAANISPLTGDVFIISSINKLLVIANKYLSVKEVYKLDPRLFKQPEGLCFTPDGDLLISNESAGVGKANILIYKHKE